MMQQSVTGEALVKVKELIAELQKHDPEALIVNDDYGTDINEFKRVKPIVISKMVVYKKYENRPSLYIRYEDEKLSECTVKEAALFSAVYLNRLDCEEVVNES